MSIYFDLQREHRDLQLEAERLREENERLQAFAWTLTIQLPSKERHAARIELARLSPSGIERSPQ